MPVGRGTRRLPLGPLTTAAAGSISTLAPDGISIGFLPIRDIKGRSLARGPDNHNAAYSYETLQITSPPTCALRADLPVMTPCGVVRIVTPRPPSTEGTSCTPTYTRRPGVETRSIAAMALSPSVL